VDETESAPANDAAEAALDPVAPDRLEPERYRVQFEASDEYVQLVEKAKALLSHAAPRAGLAELHLRAMRSLVAELEREKYAVTDRPRASAAPRQRGRHVPAAIRRAVFERDAGRCTHRAETGERCRETSRLELHHVNALLSAANIGWKT
jgi:hypothetical protein